MSLIERENRKKPQRISISLSHEVFEELSLYCQFIESSCDYVIGALIQTTVPKDREYQAWKIQPHRAPAPEFLVKAERRGRKKLTDSGGLGQSARSR